MFKRACILGFSCLLAACGGGGGGSADVPAYQPSSPGQGDVPGITVVDLTAGLVAPQFMVFNETDRFLYVADRTISATRVEGTVRKINVAGGAPVATTSVNEPVGVAFDGAGRFFVTGRNPDSSSGLMQMNLTAPWTLTDQVLVGNPAGVVFKPTGYGYLANGSDKVTVLSAGIPPITIDGTPNGLAYADGYVYVTRFNAGANGVSRFATADSSPQVFASSTNFNGPTAIAVRTTPFELYVVNTKGAYSERSVLAISASGSVRVFLSAQNPDHKLCAPGGVAIDNSASPAVLYIANGACPGAPDYNTNYAGKVLKVALPAP